MYLLKRKAFGYHAITPVLLTLMEIFLNFKSPTVLDFNTNPPQANSQRHRMRRKSTDPQDGTFPTNLLTNLLLINASFNELQPTHIQIIIIPFYPSNSRVWMSQLRSGVLRQIG